MGVCICLMGCGSSFSSVWGLELISVCEEKIQPRLFLTMEMILMGFCEGMQG